jgi:hypothetical protein
MGETSKSAAGLRTVPWSSLPFGRHCGPKLVAESHQVPAIEAA